MRITAIFICIAMIGACAGSDGDRTDDTVVANAGSTAKAAAEEVIEEPEAIISTHRWATRMQVGDAIHLVNDHGDIRIKSSADSGFDFAGTVQKLGGEQRDAEFRTEKIAAGLALVVQTPEDWNGRVDSGARVPKGAPLRLRTGAGLIQVRTGDNDVDAASKSGKIHLRTMGRLIARTDSGDILASFQGTEYGETAGSIESTTGNIDVWVQPGAALVIVTTGGVLTNNIPDSIGSTRSGGRGASIVELGTDGARLNIDGGAGAISVNLLPVAQVVER